MSHAQLITIGVSHFCEKARWALDRAARPYVEKAYPPGPHRAATAAHGGTSTPLLVLPDGTALKESTDIVRWADSGLFLEGDDGATVEALVADFDTRLGPAARALAYIYVTADPDAFGKVATKGVSAEEAAAMKERLAGVAANIRRGMGLDEEGAEAKAKATIDAVFADVNDRLANGHRFLVGDRFSAADLTFAALASPAVDLTDVQGGKGGATPAGLAAVRKAYRATPAGEFAARMYREERGVRGAAAVKESE